MIFQKLPVRFLNKWRNFVRKKDLENGILKHIRNPLTKYHTPLDHKQYPQTSNSIQNQITGRFSWLLFDAENIFIFCGRQWPGSTGDVLYFIQFRFFFNSFTNWWTFEDSLAIYSIFLLILGQMNYWNQCAIQYFSRVYFQRP